MHNSHFFHFLHQSPITITCSGQVKKPEFVEEKTGPEFKIFSLRLVSLEPSDHETVDTGVNIQNLIGIRLFLMGLPLIKTVNFGPCKAEKSVDIKLDFIKNFDVTRFTHKKDTVIVYVLAKNTKPGEKIL